MEPAPPGSATADGSRRGAWRSRPRPPRRDPRPTERPVAAAPPESSRARARPGTVSPVLHPSVVVLHPALLLLSGLALAALHRVEDLLRLALGQILRLRLGRLLLGRGRTAGRRRCPPAAAAALGRWWRPAPLGELQVPFRAGGGGLEQQRLPQ